MDITVGVHLVTDGVAITAGVILAMVTVTAGVTAGAGAGVVITLVIILLTTLHIIQGTMKELPMVNVMPITLVGLIQEESIGLIHLIRKEVKLQTEVLPLIIPVTGVREPVQITVAALTLTVRAIATRMHVQEILIVQGLTGLAPIKTHLQTDHIHQVVEVVQV